jgi:hypothetical protein
MTTEFDSWRQEAANAAESDGATLPEDHILENMFDDGCEPDEVLDPAVLARYVRQPAPRHASRMDVGPILAEHRRQDS